MEIYNMTLQDRIITYLTKVNALVSLDKLIAVSSAVGFSELELLNAISTLGNKLKGTVKQGQLYYQIAPPPKPKITPRYTGYYPTEEAKESPFLVCSCPLFHIHWEMKYGHFAECDSHHPDYPVQNPWDYMAGVMIDYEQYAKVCEQEKAIRARRAKRHLPLS